jgi:hypothetical protein
MRKQCPSVLQPPFFVMRPIFWFAYTQKRVWLSSTLENPSGLGEGVRFSYTGDPQERSIPDMVQCLLDNLNGMS